MVHKPYTLVLAILSMTPVRLRLKIAGGDRLGETISQQMQNITNCLNTDPQISHVKTNMYSGTLVIYHDNLAGVLATLDNMGISFAKSDLNQQIRTINSAVDLRLLFPLGLSILAVRQLILKGLQIEAIPWYVLAWYAFDSFMKLNVYPPPAPSRDRSYAKNY
jgi:hypothetical protein